MVIFGSVAWQEKHNKAKFAHYCMRHCELKERPSTMPATVNHKAEFKKFCKPKGIGTALGEYKVGNGDWAKVEHYTEK